MTHTANPLAASLRRIAALIFRYATLLLRSPPRLLETMYWSMINTMFLGYLNLFLLQSKGSGAPVSFHLILGASLLLELFIRPQISFIIVFMEEIYARNIAQLYVSPLRTHEQLIGYTAIMLLRLAIGVLPAIFLCQFLFGYNLFSLGVWFIPFAFNLVFSGAVCGIFLMSLLLRFGQSAEWFGWMLGWFFIPFMGVYYPLEILPEPMRLIGAALPPSSIFEGLRSFASAGAVEPALLLKSFCLNCLYLALALLVFARTLHGARQRGTLLSLNE